MIKLLIAILVLIAFSTSGASANPQPINILTSPSPHASSQPGEILTVKLVIVNNSSTPQALVETFQLPHNWKVVSANRSQLDLDPNGSLVRLVALKIPATCGPGTYSLVYNLMNLSDRSLAGADTILIKVSEVADLALSVGDIPHIVLAGEICALGLNLKNRGNADLHVKLEASTDKIMRYVSKPRNLLLKPGETRRCQLLFESSENIRTRSESIIRITATAKTAKGTPRSLSKAVRIEVIPRVSRRVDPYVRIPAYLKLTATTDREGSAYQIELSGRGSLSEADSHLGFVLKLPDIEDVGRYTSRDRIYIDYKRGPIALRLGDQGYSLSSLLERYNYARGAQVTYQERTFSAKAFFAQKRWLPRPVTEAGMSLCFGLGRRVSLGTSFLSKKNASVDSSRHYLYSLGGSLAVAGGDLSFEVAVSPEGKTFTRSQTAQNVTLHGKIRKDGNYSFEWIRAEPEFKGYYHDTEYLLAAIRLPLSTHFSWRTNFRNYARNLDNDISKADAIRERQVATGILWTMRGGHRFTLDFRRFSKWDNVARSATDFTERVIRLSAAHTGGLLSFSGSAERGELANDAAKTVKQVERYSGSLTWHPFPNQTYAFYGHTGTTQYSPEARRYTNMGISATWYLTRSVVFRIRFLRYKQLSVSNMVYDNLLGSLSWKPREGHTFELRGNLEQPRRHGEKKVSLLLQYKIALGIPSSRKKSVGSLEGKVYRADIPGHPPVPNVVVIASGDMAVTDSDGNFTIQGLKPGNHSLYLDPRSLGTGMTTIKPTPIVLSIKGGQASKITIGIVRGSSITARFGFHAETTSRAPTHETLSQLSTTLMPNEVDFSHIWMEISNGDETFVEPVGNDHEVAFDHLRPGKWRIVVKTKDPSPDYVFDPSRTEIELRPGESKQMVVNILPKQRLLKIIDRGALSVKSD